ncbi:hypothetical protein ABRP57_06690 [Pectobacterium aroidearum]|nr:MULTISPECIES: hypothetical protein [Pectobacterium]UXK02610.1 hypothetical protein N5056_16235 [Pectobacterium aroidearum]
MDGSYDTYNIAALPDKRINITGKTMSFECDIDKVTPLGGWKLKSCIKQGYVMKKFFKWVLYIFVALIVIGYFADDKKANKGSESNASVSNAASTPVPESKAPEVYKTTASGLFNAYEENEVAIDEKMKGKIVEISGTVQSIDKDFTDAIIVQLKTGNEFLPAMMNIIDSEKSTAISLKKGQKIVVRCESVMRIIGAPAGRNCVFVN